MDDDTPSGSGGFPPDEFLAGWFVPEGATPPPHVLGPDWIRIPVDGRPRGQEASAVPDRNGPDGVTEPAPP
jgi:hypothetical protein